jgi:hypothetical protein
MSATPKPVACTLTSQDLATQRERWLRLGSAALVERVETEDGLRLSFRADPGVEPELASLLAVERECCAWADWLLEQDAETLTVAVRSTGDGISALHGMFTAL